MKQYSYLIKPASSLCNLRCQYCFYHDVSEHRTIQSTGFMSESTMIALIEKACQVERDATITFAFQGGEPTLIGLSFYEKFVTKVKQTQQSSQIIHYAIQTNGLLMDEHWCDFFKKNKFLVGISLDGYRENHDYFRISATKQGTYKQVMSAIELFKAHEVDFNILTVLSAPLAKHPLKLYRFFKQHQFKYVQLIPCLPGLDQKEDPFALTPALFASFYKAFYEQWYLDYQKNDYMSVTLFDNIIPMFRGVSPQQCGMLGFCSPQFVIEGDGGVYPCDFYVLDQYLCGNINTNSLQEIQRNIVMHQFLHEKKRMSPLCGQCKFKSICNGNCKRLNITYFDDEICGYQQFLEHAHHSMIKIAKTL